MAIGNILVQNATMIEKQIENQIISYLRTIGAWVTKIQAGGLAKAYTNRKTGAVKVHRIHLAHRGVPDLLACIDGKFVAIEVKKDAKEIAKWERTAKTDPRSLTQHIQQFAIREAGGLTCVVCSVEQLQETLKTMGLLPKRC